MGLVDYAESIGTTTAVPRRVFLSHTSDLGKPDEPGSFVSAAVEAVLRLDMKRHLDLNKAVPGLAGEPPLAVDVGVD